MKCHECEQAELVISCENYHYAEYGLDNVTLVGIDVSRCPSRGMRFAEIPAMLSLHRAIALTLIEKDEALSPREVVFLRESLGWSTDDFAAFMHVDHRTVTRW